MRKRGKGKKSVVEREWFIPVPVPTLDKFGSQFRIQTYLFSTVFQQLKLVQNLAISMLEAALFPNKLVGL